MIILNKTIKHTFKEIEQLKILTGLEGIPEDLVEYDLALDNVVNALDISDPNQRLLAGIILLSKSESILNEIYHDLEVEDE